MYKSYCADKNCRCEKKKPKEEKKKMFSSLQEKKDDFADELDKLNSIKNIKKSTKL